MGKRFPVSSIDPIRVQIETLEDQLRLPLPVTERIMSSCPFLPPACGFLIGLIVQRRLGLPFSFWAAVFPVLLLPLFSLFIIPSSHQRLVVLVWLSVPFGLFLGAVRLQTFQTPDPQELRNIVTANPTLATLGGRILTEPRLEDRSQWVFGKYQWTSRNTSFIAAVEEMMTRTGWQPASGKIYASISEPVRNMAAGDRIRFHCRLETPLPPDNPGAFNGKQYLEDQGIFFTAEIPGIDAVEQHEKNKGTLVCRLKNRLRGWSREALDAYGGDQTESSALSALLLGKRSALAPQTWTAFQKTGLAHFISLSGMHVGILTGMLWWAGQKAGLEKRSRAFICILLIGLYALIIPPRPPTLRAVFLAEFIFLSILIQRRPRMLNTLSLTALILLLFRPTELFQASWQLSYATVFGIVLLYEPVFRFLSMPLYAYPKITEGLFRLPAGSRLWAGVQSILKLLSVGFSAWIGGAGILLWHFGTITLLSAVWTVLVFPLVFLILLSGFLKLLLVSLAPTPAALCSVLLDFLCDTFSRIVIGLAKLDPLSFRIGRVGLWVILLYYAWLFLIRFTPLRGKPNKILIAIGGLAILLSLMIPKLQRSLSKDLIVTCLSVGHGLAVVAELPGGHTLLFDGGSISRKNPGGRIVVPYLNHRGIQSLDTVVLSHGDLDHYNGLPEVLSAVETKTVYVNPGFLERARRSSGAGLMKTIFESNDSTLSAAVFPAVSAPVRMASLWPDAAAAADAAVSDNDKSEVLLMEYAGRTILLCGDIEEYAQRRILNRYPDLKADVLLLPHHGSRNNILPAFIRQLRPEIRVISCARNRVQSVTDLDEAGSNWYTPVHGAVTITIKADGTLHAAGFGGLP